MSGLIARNLANKGYKNPAIPVKFPSAPLRHKIPLKLIFFDNAKFKATADPAE